MLLKKKRMFLPISLCGYMDICCTTPKKTLWIMLKKKFDGLFYDKFLSAGKMKKRPGFIVPSAYEITFSP